MISLGRYLLLIALVFSASLFAQTQQSPNQLLTQVGDQLFSEIGKINSQGTASKSDMAHIVDQYLMPNIDVKFVSYKLLGKHIKGIDRQQATAFISAVEHYLTTTYASALMKYTGQEIKFEESNDAAESEFATVKTQIIADNAPTIDLHFKLRQGKDGSWKVYDIVAEGISLLSAKQKEVIQRISEVGLDQVTAELNSK
ncbi:ABC transporter substrate-binding protein [Pseudoalteromonas sp. SG43-7]|uniref:Phospholipid-binding protein MlaC n=1 Tax=Pseudoalteromonas rhizosphaerae TaxID=2518973 RepID=A0ABW8KW35_9GAMM|nr:MULTISPECIES: ABC transporter substrate-binding protein [Pseudoalteromonas]MBB1310396.1 ABC transporter substrate-binding protein [Pseudoalteromonas sp. SR41-8]MBB1334246.1 ABC transporter substrate-binding protein [Pseudoalteromonas sp. SR41-6]MBB1341974.1 ABC transporter substrate-binding protein [Pseudoalteromonas sp. SR45-6]MBB1418443.1 ABC transporter substrate-binding protein [Pseudoalteromonas sp. SG44-1]MBB1421860.1 ABC transporter substrate-binding protein [Pseudoalteromonas sp. SG